MRGLLVVVIAAFAWAPAAFAGTPVDGLVLRLDLTTGKAGGTLFINGCSSLDVVGRVQGASSGTTLSKSAAGWSDDSAATGASGGVDLAYEKGALVFFNEGWWLRDQQGHRWLLGLESAPDTSDSCKPLTTTSSSVGDVVDVQWQATECDYLDKVNNCRHNKPAQALTTYNGTGCMAIYRNGNRLVETIELGGCVPSTFPPVAATPPPSQSPLEAMSTNRGFALRQDDKPVRHLAPATYRFVVLRYVHLTGPDVKKVNVPGSGSVWVLDLKPGTYQYWWHTGAKHTFVVG